ncbi:MAG TPA: HNH endonuclease signature motif containing protein [Streptosporangiaceae bacterium]|nr:HNH endonuclease signature motif containing protein [Streptosporangiaceae bacterium]
MKRTQMPPRTVSLPRTPFPAGASLTQDQGLSGGTGLRSARLALVDGAGPVVLAPPRWQRQRKDTIPPKVRKLVHARDDRYCQHCGGHFPDGGIHLHHRRLKQNGGDPRPHTDCPCNLISLCWTCHDWLHNTAEGRAKAKRESFIIPNATPEPGLVSVLLHGDLDGEDVQAWLTCAGGPDGRVYVAPAGAA